MHSNIDRGRNSFSNTGKDRHTLRLRHDLPERASKKQGTKYKLIFDADVHEDATEALKVKNRNKHLLTILTSDLQELSQYQID